MADWEVEFPEAEAPFEVSFDDGSDKLPDAAGRSEFGSAEFSVWGTDLDALSDAIAEKAGVDSPTWPEGFRSAVEGIEAGGDWTSVKIGIATALEVTVGENAVSNVPQAINYFTSILSEKYFFIALLQDAPDKYPQAVCVHNIDTGGLLRWTNTSVNAVPNSYAYDAMLISGTTYQIICWRKS